MRRNALLTMLSGVVGLSLGTRASADKLTSDPRLTGKWRSDREKTFQHRPELRTTNPASAERYRALFGTFTWQFENSELVVDEGSQVARYRYKVVASDARSVVLDVSILGRKQLMQIYFQDEYLYSLGGFNVEFFRRIEA
jgi:hypothetical protein